MKQDSIREILNRTDTMRFSGSAEEATAAAYSLT